MKNARATRIRQWVLLGVLGVELAVVAAVYGPDWLRGMDAFRVRRVEVVGNRYVRANTVMRASGITGDDNVFDDLSAIRRRVERLQVVRSVLVRRRLPGTLVIHVTEVEPVALVPMPELQPVDGDGRVLPIDPAGLAVDLPVVGVESGAGPTGRLQDTSAVRLVRLTARIRREAPQIADRVSMLKPDTDGVILTLRDPVDVRVVLPADPQRLHFVELQAALNDLTARGELDRVRGIDLRYRDEAIIAFGI